MRFLVSSRVYAGLGYSPRTTAVYLVGIRSGWSPNQTYNTQVLLEKPKVFCLDQARTSRPQVGKLQSNGQKGCQC